jgi:hypothetical protein
MLGIYNVIEMERGVFNVIEMERGVFVMTVLDLSA